MNLTFKSLSVAAVLFFAFSAFAAVPQKLQVKPDNRLRGTMAVQGGKAGSLYSLLDLRSTATKDKKRERFVIDLGDQSLQNLRSSIGYYTVEIKDGRKLTLNFSQAMNTKFNQADLIKKLKGSPFVSKSMMVFDPVTQTLSLSFDLKKQSQAKVVSIRDRKHPTRLIVDLYEVR